jgi:hypothetical protein
MKIVFEGTHLLVLERDHWQYAERKRQKPPRCSRRRTTAR